MTSWLGGILKDPEKRAVLSWLGGGAVVVAGGIWAVFTFYVEHRDAHDKKGGTNITVGQGIGQVGEIHGPVNIGPSPEQIAQIQKPQGDQLAAKDAQIAELHKIVEMPVEKNPSAEPGTQQAVSAAVGSIARGAAEGHPRLQEALDLLKKNKIAEATQLLNAVAEDKSTQAEKDRKEAAIAYRNLGAIAGLADPKRAQEAYEKALALDPDDAESLYWAGTLGIERGDLAKREITARACAGARNDKRSGLVRILCA